MTETNSHGLSRYIPQDVRRAVRQRDGFGCVICATPIIEYEHVDPTFINAHKHDPDAIALLCPVCHRQVTSRQISKDLVKNAMQNPAAKKSGSVKHQLYFCNSHPTVIIGGQQIIRCNVPLHISGHDIFKFDYEDGKFLFSAQFWGSDGKKTLEIVKNEWKVSSGNLWDFRIEGNKMHIKEKENEPAMIIRIENNDTFIIERLDMLIGKLRIKGNENKLKIGTLSMTGCGISDGPYGIYSA